MTGPKPLMIESGVDGFETRVALNLNKTVCVKIMGHDPSLSPMNKTFEPVIKVKVSCVCVTLLLSIDPSLLHPHFHVYVFYKRLLYFSVFLHNNCSILTRLIYQILYFVSCAFFAFYSEYQFQQSW